MLKYLNPLKWLEAIWTTLSRLIGGLLQLLGIGPAPKAQFEDLSKADVDAAAAEAHQQQAAADLIPKIMQPEMVVSDYCRATSEDRAAMDLSALTGEQQDWLLGLSDADLALLGAAGEGACRKSLEERRVCVSVSRIRQRQEETAPAPVLQIPAPEEEDRWQHIGDVLREAHPGLFGDDCAPAFKPRRRHA